MPQIGRPRGSVRKSSVTRSICLPEDIYKKCVWISDLWTKEALSDGFDGSNEPEYWNTPRVISSVLSEYFQHLESQEPELVSYFEKCREREANRKSISRSPSQPHPQGVQRSLRPIFSSHPYLNKSQVGFGLFTTCQNSVHFRRH